MATTVHEGGCQCGNVRYRVEMDIGDVMSCNCSRCGKLGSLLAFAPAEKFELLSGADDLATYEFNKHVIQHKFCTTCGIESFATGTNPKSGAAMAAINVRSLDNIDVGALKVKAIDGKVSRKLSCP